MGLYLIAIDINNSFTGKPKGNHKLIFVPSGTTSMAKIPKESIKYDIFCSYDNLLLKDQSR